MEIIVNKFELKAESIVKGLSHFFDPSPNESCQTKEVNEISVNRPRHKIEVAFTGHRYYTENSLSDSIPNDILLKIFSLVNTVPELIQMNCLNRNWNQLVKDDKRAINLFNANFLLLEAVKLVESFASIESYSEKIKGYANKIMMHLSQINLPTAKRLIEKKGDCIFRSVGITEIAKIDCEWALTFVENSKQYESKNFKYSTLIELIPSLASQNLNKAQEMVKREDIQEWRSCDLNKYIIKYMALENQELAYEIWQKAELSSKDLLASKIIGAISRHSPEEALAWALELKNEKYRDKSLLAIVKNLISRQDDIEGAKQVINKMKTISFKELAYYALIKKESLVSIEDAKITIQNMHGNCWRASTFNKTSDRIRLRCKAYLSIVKEEANFSDAEASITAKNIREVGCITKALIAIKKAQLLKLSEAEKINLTEKKFESIKQYLGNNKFVSSDIDAYSVKNPLWQTLFDAKLKDLDLLTEAKGEVFKAIAIEEAFKDLYKGIHTIYSSYSSHKHHYVLIEGLLKMVKICRTIKQRHNC